MSSLRLGMLSTFPPTLCGLATFSSALRRALVAQGHQVDVIRVDDGSTDHAHDPAVMGVMLAGSPASIRRAAMLLSECDAVVIQHEYGIFGGPDGDEVLQLMRDIDVPIVVVLHTVPLQPSGRQTEILIELCARADLVVVMSEAARERLIRTFFPIEDDKVITIPHGAALAAHVLDPSSAHPTMSRRLLTWGLLGPGKGIEHVIDALGLLHDFGHAVNYTIAGVTHPKVRQREGTRYRDGLEARAEALGIRHLVTFDESYRTVEEITEFIASFGIVVLPYENTDQVTSGVLVDSLAAGRAIISTSFPHAVEMLSDGAGILVPPRDARSLAVAIRTLTSQDEDLRAAQAAARDIAPQLGWPAVAASYADAIRTALVARSRV